MRFSKDHPTFKRLRREVATKVAIARSRDGAGYNSYFPIFDHEKFRKRLERQYGLTGKYLPHQGKQEAARRLRRGW